MQQLEYFPYNCPHCGAVRNAAHVAAELDDSVFAVEAARRNTRRQTRHPGPGQRASTGRPGCSQQMPSSELRGHRIPCVRSQLAELRATPIQLAPKDPDPYPNFRLANVSDMEVTFLKVSNYDQVTVDLRKIAGITVSREDNIAYIRVLGRIAWREDIKRWRFAPNAPVGRPRKSIGRVAQSRN